MSRSSAPRKGTWPLPALMMAGHSAPRSLQRCMQVGRACGHSSVLIRYSLCNGRSLRALAYILGHEVILDVRCAFPTCTEKRDRPALCLHLKSRSGASAATRVRYDTPVLARATR